MHNQSVLRKKYKLWFDYYKGQFTCLICNKDNPEVLEFHHLDPKIKKYSISTMICQCMRLQDIQAELKKCIPVCRNCHAEIENGSISYNDILKKAEEYSKYYRPGENILDGFPTMMLAFAGFTIVYKYYVDFIKNERIIHNFKESEDDYSSEERHPDYVNFCNKRIETKDPEVDMELDRPDVLGEFIRGFTDMDLS